MKILSNLTIKTRLITLVGFTSILMITIGVLGLNGMNSLGISLGNVYKNHLIPTGQLGGIVGLMRDNRTQLLLALQHDEKNPLSSMHNHKLGKHTNRIVDNIQEISQIWKLYMANEMKPVLVALYGQ